MHRCPFCRAKLVFNPKVVFFDGMIVMCPYCYLDIEVEWHNIYKHFALTLLDKSKLKGDNLLIMPERDW